MRAIILPIWSISLIFAFALVAPAQAAVHKPSGIVVPDEIDGMQVRIAEGRDSPFRETVKSFGQLYSFRNGPDLIDIFVVKPAPLTRASGSG
jgi:hypothetical protein